MRSNSIKSYLLLGLTGAIASLALTSPALAQRRFGSPRWNPPQPSTPVISETEASREDDTQATSPPGDVELSPDNPNPKAPRRRRTNHHRHRLPARRILRKSNSSHRTSLTQPGHRRGDRSCPQRLGPGGVSSSRLPRATGRLHPYRQRRFTHRPRRTPPLGLPLHL